MGLIELKYFRITFHMLQDRNDRQISYLKNVQIYNEFNFLEDIIAHPDASYGKWSISCLPGYLSLFFHRIQVSVYSQKRIRHSIFQTVIFANMLGQLHF